MPRLPATGFLVWGLVLCPVWAIAAEGEAELDALVVDEFDVERDGAPLMLPAKIDGLDRIAWMLIDTGSTGTLFHEKHRSLLGDPTGTVALNSPTGRETVATYSPPDGTVGSAPIAGRLPVGVQDLTSFHEHMGWEVDGILGMDFLESKIVQIDFDKGKVRFLSGTPADAGKKTLIRYRDGRIPTIPVSWGHRRKEWTRIDTGGFGACTVSRETFADLAARGEITGLHSQSFRVINGVGSAKTGFVTAMSISGFESQRISVSEFVGASVGMSYLSRFELILDFPHKRLYLKRGARFDHPEKADASGLSLIKRDDRILVAGVSPNSSAAKSGFQKKDVILRVDGTDIGGISLQRLRELLQQPGATHTIWVERGAERLKLAIALRDDRADEAK